MVRPCSAGCLAAEAHSCSPESCPRLLTSWQAGTCCLKVWARAAGFVLPADTIIIMSHGASKIDCQAAIFVTDSEREGQASAASKSSCLKMRFEFLAFSGSTAESVLMQRVCCCYLDRARVKARANGYLRAWVILLV